MTEKRAIPDTKKNAKKCRYPECPVYNECLDKNNERLFCSRGSTKCTIEKKDAYAYAAPTKLNTGLIVYFIVKKVLQQKKNVATKSINSYK